MTVQAVNVLEQLYRQPDDRKAEVVNGEIVTMSPTGFMPSYAAGEIYASLRHHARRTGSGFAIADNTGFVVDLPNRQSFSPDAAFYTGDPTGMRFLKGAPVFAAEVRSEGDYGPAAEEAMATKRSEYFVAGTLVVWDVDLLNENVVLVYRHGSNDNPIIYRRGQLAEAEPAVPGWQMKVDDLFVEFE